MVPLVSRRESALLVAVAVLVLAGTVVVPVATAAGGAQPDGVNRSTAGYTVTELSRANVNTDTPGSVLWYDDGGTFSQMWLRHVPTGLGVANNVERAGKYVTPRTTVRRDTLYIGGIRGRDAEPQEHTVHVVTWREGTQMRAGPNGTEREVTVPVDVTERTATVTLGGGYDNANAIPLPTSYESTERATVWVEGYEDSLRWTFSSQTAQGAAAVSLNTINDAVWWGVTNIFVWVLIVALPLIYLADRALRKAGRGPKWGALEYGFVSFAGLFFCGFIAYNGVSDTLAQRPQLLGVAGGILVAGVATRALSRPATEALFLQFAPGTENVATDGSGDWHLNNQVHPVVEREDGTKVVPREGWLAFIAAVWPGKDARPKLEFQGEPARNLEPEPESDEESDPFPDEDAGASDRIRTAITGGSGTGEAEPEYDEIYLVDPLADDVITYEKETFTFSLPDLWTFPDDEESGTWIRGVPVPSVEWGKLLGGVAVFSGVFFLAQLFTASPLLSWLSVAAVAFLVTATPKEGAARVSLAPAQFDSVLANVTQMLEGWSDQADADYYRRKFHSEQATRRVERQQFAEEGDRSIFGEIADEFAPDVDAAEGGGADRAGADDESSRGGVSADD